MLKKQDLEDLKRIYLRLKNNMYVSKLDLIGLDYLINKYETQRIKFNEKNYKRISEKRKLDKNYSNHYVYKDGRRR